MDKLVIEGMDEELMSDLASLAAENHLQIHVQARQLLRLAVPVRDRAKLVARLDAIAAMTPKEALQPDSLDLLREDRQR